MKKISSKFSNLPNILYPYTVLFGIPILIILFLHFWCHFDGNGILSVYILDTKIASFKKFNFDNLILGLIAYIVVIFVLNNVKNEIIKTIKKDIKDYLANIDVIFNKDKTGADKDYIKNVMDKFYVTIKDLEKKCKFDSVYLVCMPLSIFALIFSIFYSVDPQKIFLIPLVLLIYIILAIMLKISIIAFRLLPIRFKFSEYTNRLEETYKKYNTGFGDFIKNYSKNKKNFVEINELNIFSSKNFILNA